MMVNDKAFVFVSVVASLSVSQTESFKIIVPEITSVQPITHVMIPLLKRSRSGNLTQLLYENKGLVTNYGEEGSYKTGGGAREVLTPTKRGDGKRFSHAEGVSTL